MDHAKRLDASTDRRQRWQAPSSALSNYGATTTGMVDSSGAAAASPTMLSSSDGPDFTAKSATLRDRNMRYWKDIWFSTTQEKLSNDTARCVVYQTRWMVVALVVALLLFYVAPRPGSEGSHSSAMSVQRQQTPQWEWDHNAFYYTNITTKSHVLLHGGVGHDAAAAAVAEPAAATNLLMVQLVCTNNNGDGSSAAARQPNRAYARQWQRDFVLYHGSSDHGDSVRDVLHNVMQWRPQLYDQVLILPCTAMIMDLDFDLASLLHNSSALVGLSHDNVMLWYNLRHPLARAFLCSWRELRVDEGRSRDSGNDDDIQELHQVLVSMNNVSSPDVLLQTVDVRRRIAVASSASANDMHVQAMADAVCYRYYPQCDVL